MSSYLDTKQYVPLTSEERQLIRDVASAHGIGAGLLSRVLLLHGLENIAGLAVSKRVAEEKSISQERVSAGARDAAAAGWVSRKQSTKKKAK